ncbi:MAG: response regulator [Spongiibacteraceae bacterium]
MKNVLQNILYVEDEPDIQRIVKLALELVAGMRVINCSSGMEAIARAHEISIDLILLDVMMPQMDGPTTLSRLREIPSLKDTPVVFMTAKAHPGEVAHFKSLGARDVIAKPFDPMKLADTLRDIWGRIDTAPIATVAAQGETGAVQIENAAEKRFAERMAALTEQFRRELPSRLMTLQQQWQVLDAEWNIAERNLDALRGLHSSTHNLAGAGATFGYDELTTRARAIDRHFKIALEQKQLPDAAARIEIGTLFAALESELQRVIAEL